MPWRVYARYRRPLLVIVALTALLQLTEVIFVEVGGSLAVEGAFAATMNWYALLLFVVVPAVLVWHALRNAIPSAFGWKPLDAFWLGLMYNATTGPVLLVIGLISVVIRVLRTGWSSEATTIVVGSAVGFVLALVLGGVIGWVVFRLARPRSAAR